MAKFSVFIPCNLLPVVISAAFGVSVLAAAPEAENARTKPEWKRAAEARIQQYRMSDCEVIVTDGFGNPLEGAEVELKMQQHAYWFGTAVNVPYFLYGGDREGGAERPVDWQSPPNDDVRRYREAIKEWFNVAVFENRLKPAPFGWLDPGERADTYRVLKWLDEHQIPVRGHYLVGHAKFFGDGQLHDPGVQETAIAHGYDKAWELRGRFVQWDAFNHPLSTGAPVDFIERSLRAMRAADPHTPLYLNEQWILAGGAEYDRRTRYLELARELKARDVPLDGLGAMGHMLADHLLTEPEDLVATLDAIGEIGLPVIVTEHDFRLEDESLAPGYEEKFLVTVYSHPVSEGIILWGFTDLAHWHGGAVLYDSEWNLKPAGKVWQRYVKGEWWTDAAGQTDAYGRFVERLTHGDYTLEVRHGGRTVHREVKLPSGGKRVHLVYPRDFPEA